MALALDWPAELPQGFEADDYSYEPQSNILRSEMDVGPAKVRRRSTADPIHHSGSMIMSKDDYLNHFLPFFLEDCAGGTEAFDFPNPFDNGATQIEVRFLIDTRGNPFQVKQFSPESVRVSFVLEELPS